MTCGTSTNSSDTNDLSCCRAQEGSTDCTGTQLCVADVCTACTVSSGTTSNCVTTDQNAFYCNNTEGSPMNGACYTISCESNANCDVYYQNCDGNNQCRDAVGCDADASLCRGSGTGVNGVCSSDSCTECAITINEGVTSSNCPQPTDGTAYCNTSTTSTTGNFCSSPTCTDTSCSVTETCDYTGTGACK